MLEEKAEALFRDAIGSMAYKEALKAKSDGYDSMEKDIFKILSNSASALGAKLKSIEVRELSFPILEAQEVKLAMKEAETRSKKLEAQRELELRKIEDARIASLETARQERENVAAGALALKMKIQDERALAKVKAESEQNLAKVQGKVAEEKARLAAEQEIAKLKSETAMIVAQGEVEAMLIKERGKHTVALEKAQMEAKAAAAMGEVLDKNPSLLQLKLKEIEASVERERLQVLKSFASNPQALLPESITREIIRMRFGERPQEFIQPYPVAMPGSSSSKKK